MVAIAASGFDLLGALILPKADATSRLRDRARRVTRTRTLDGGATYIDLGYSDLDRDLRIMWPATDAELITVERLIENYSSVIICTSNGAFEAVISLSEIQGLQTALTVMIKAKLSE